MRAALMSMAAASFASMGEAKTRQEFLAANDAVTFCGPTGLVTCSRDELSRYGRKDAPEAAAQIIALTTEVKSLKTELADREGKIKQWIDKAKEEFASGGSHSAETKSALEKLATGASEIAGRILSLEQKLSANENGGVGQGEKSLGARFAEADQVVAWRKNGGMGKVKMAVKAITSITTGAGSAGDLIVPQRLPGIISDPNRPMTLRALLSVGRTTSSSIEYVRETGFTNAAAMVAEGTTKPESSIEFNLATAPIRTMAHWVQASKQILDDVPQLESYINTRLRYGLELVEEDQLLSGDGAGQNLLGLVPQSTDYDASFSQPGDTRIDTVRRAINQVRKSEYRADAIVLHPDDWTEIELTKTTEGAYVWANPRGLLGPTLWGLPVVDTTAVEPGEFLVGAFRLAAQIWDREDANVQASEEDRDNFIKNMITIRAEERLGLAVYRPEALVYGDFDTIVSS